jgi:N-acyl amino acid synthase of PEP-CTERM/exosortase system
MTPDPSSNADNAQSSEQSGARSQSLPGSPANANTVAAAPSVGLASRFGGDFFDYFSLELADTDQLLEESFRLRHRVYVEEMKFERPEDFPDGMERDGYEAHSLAMLLRHNTSGNTIGCVRLIVADPHDPAKPFPFEHATGGSVGQHPVFQRTKRVRLGEVSRLAIAPEFRRRRNDQEMGLYSVLDAAEAGQDPRRRNNLPPALGLVFAGASMGMEIGLHAVFVMMELRLARLLRTLGIEFEQVSEAIEYHGLRAPFVITREAMQGDIAPQLRSALDLVRERTVALSQSELPLLRAVRQGQQGE